MHNPKLCIHRGADEIGGSCVEIQSAGGERLFLDIGMPLIDEKPSPNHLPKIPGLREGDPSIKGILISHMHADHYGLLHCAHETIPVYMSRYNRDGLAFASDFVPGTHPCPRAQILTAGQPLRIGGTFTVTPHPMNHSAFGGFSLLVETAGKRILYSGDFRGHGRKDSLADFCENPPENIAALLLEGTTLSRAGGERFLTEQQIETRFAGAFQDAGDGLNTVVCSGQNIDRLVTIAKAARKAGKRLVVDFYTSQIIALTKHPSIVPYFEKHTSVCVPENQRRKIARKKDDHLFDRVKAIKPRRVFLDKLAQLPAARLSQYVFQLSGGIMLDLDKLEPSPKFARPIYSLWDGYWKDPNDMLPLKAFVKKHGYDAPQFIHTSGHATREDLERYAKAANAKQIIPIHTKVPALYKSIFPTARLLKNGEWLNL